jgi:hypothetical protein
MTAYRDRLEAGEHSDKANDRTIAAEAKRLETERVARDKELERRLAKLEKQNA